MIWSSSACRASVRVAGSGKWSGSMIAVRVRVPA